MAKRTKRAQGVQRLTTGKQVPKRRLTERIGTVGPKILEMTEARTAAHRKKNRERLQATKRTRSA